MARITSRSFLAQLRSAGVDDLATGPNISEDVQLVYIVDDLSRLIAPRAPVEGFVTIGIPVNVGRVSGIDFRPPADSAAIITWMRNDGAIDSLFEIGTARQLTNDISAGTVDFFTGPGPARSTFRQGTKAVQTAGLLLPAGENIPDRFPDLVVEPGQIFLWVGNAINNAMTMTFSWREVPV